jgi:hypothetical protein
MNMTRLIAEMLPPLISLFAGVVGGLEVGADFGEGEPGGFE